MKEFIKDVHDDVCAVNTGVCIMAEILCHVTDADSTEMDLAEQREHEEQDGLIAAEARPADRRFPRVNDFV